MKYSVWKTITLGVHQSVEAYSTAIESTGFKISPYAHQMLAKTLISAQQVTLELFSATTAELGFAKGATFKQICARIKELGYELCPAEVGPALRLAYPDQPNGEWCRIVMETLSDSDGSPSVFLIEHDGGGLWLRSVWLYPADVWSPASRWVFCRRAGSAVSGK